jgi:hypothetical protein
MYCKTCGTNYNSMALYCINDGQTLAETSADAITLLNGESKFCANCSQPNQGVDNYCSHCGTPFYKVADHTDFDMLGSISSPAGMPSFSSQKLSLGEFIFAVRRGWLGSLISIILLFILSLIISSSVTAMVNRFIGEKLHMMGDLLGSSKLVGLTDVMLLTNLVSTTLKVDLGGANSASASLHIGLLVLLLVPFISLFLGGFIAAKRNQISDARDSFTLSVGIGAVYALFLALVSLFGGTSESLTIPLVQQGVHIDHSYSFFNTLLQGFFFGFLFSFSGALLGVGSYKITAHLRQASLYGESFHQAVSTLLWGVLVTLVYVVIVFSIKAEGDTPLWAWILLVPQAAFYLWNVAQLNTLSFSNGSTFSDNSEMVSVSIFQGINQMGEDANPMNPYIYFSFVVVLVLFLLAGSRLKKASAPLQKSLLVFSGTYALLMAVLVGVSKLTLQAQGRIPLLDSNEIPAIFGGFGVISTFFICFIVSAVIAFVGALFSEQLSLRKYINK